VALDKLLIGLNLVSHMYEMVIIVMLTLSVAMKTNEITAEEN
jgi:hypothetical protein